MGGTVLVVEKYNGAQAPSTHLPLAWTTEFMGRRDVFVFHFLLAVAKLLIILNAGNVCM